MFKGGIGVVYILLAMIFIGGSSLYGYSKAVAVIDFEAVGTVGWMILILHCQCLLVLLERSEPYLIWRG